MLAGTLAFIAGIYYLMQFTTLPPLWLLLILPFLFYLVHFHPKFRLLLFLFTGFCWALVFSHMKIINQLDENIENNDVFIKGVIISLPEVHHDHVRFLIDIDEIRNLNGEKIYFPEIARLSWYKNKVIPEPGEQWQLKVKLKRPYGFMNPGGFDYEAWLLRRGIKATGYIKFDKQNKKTGEDSRYYIQKLRFKIANKLRENLDKPLLGLVLALTLGDRSQLEVEQWEILTKTGTSHLIAISGLHLGLIAGFIYFIARFIWSRFYSLTQRIPAPLFASIMAFFGAFFYALLSGFALPAQRALIMIAVFLLATLWVRQVLFTNVICFTLILVLILDPFAIMAADFYLSFMAVLFILYLTRFRLNKHHEITRWVHLQCLLSFALCPILIFWFKQIPVYSVLANLITIPVVGFLVVPLSLVALLLLFLFPVVAQYLYALIDKINEFNWAWLKFLSQQDNAVIPVAAPNSLSLLLAIAGLLILMMPKGLPARYSGLLFFLPLLFPFNEKLKPGEFDFNLLDVGQGLSAVIQTKNHTLVYDTGAKFSKRFNTGDAVIKPYLRIKGVKEISSMIISHGDNDHIGGANAIINNFKVNKILTSVPEHSLDQKSEICHAGQKWHWDGVDFTVLYPVTETTYLGNNASCVLKVSSKNGSVLLTGDIEKEAEASLIKQYGDMLHADILLVPHHGSRTSSTKAFVSMVSPDYAFIPAGYRNRFGFPKKDIINRYEDQDVVTYISYESGELSAKFRDKHPQIDEFRTKNRRFWHH
ncbi:MAG: DNA internalization-related competence protein ComEC/Rec2 [Proteobacteria bacterium]|nr:DNA internalization-related competence protein ComEC/Rec2 [Pseudomonadota bacterium]NOG59462.1 DNA internalization-related competence protein ComEC/Rec2 [Pseudomonadota bacterium]